MKGKVYTFKSVYQFLKSRQFINHVSCELNKETHQVLEYGVPGTLLLQNIKRNWRQVMVGEQSNAFPIERRVPNFIEGLSNKENGDNWSSEPGERQFEEYRRMYLEVSKLTKGRLPFSVVTNFQNFNLQNDTSDEKNQEIDILFGGLTQNLLVSQCYTSPSGVNRIFDFWLQRRLSWWKKYAKNPSKFSVSSSSKENAKDNDNMALISNGNSQVMSINYEFPWGTECVEVVQNHGDALFKNLSEQEQKSYSAKTTSGKKCFPFCIECSMSIESAATTFLVDAYNERTSLAKMNKSPKVNPVLQLHPQLSPFESALLATCESVTTMNELLHICTKLEQDLHRAGVSVFNAARHGATPDAHFRRNDQLGIPYTLILNEKTLLDGSITMRCRDTEIMRPIHVSQAVEELRRNVNATLE